ncbi:MAG: peptidyl-prolyl cis-trans isomerase [Lachnospiraceae bacterium]|nr:peptidyl-prolyl cis-trans isomerase [Lachnospiraceae bacterium]
MGKLCKRILSIGLCLVMVLGLAACNSKDDWIFSLNGEMLYDKDVAIFAYIYATEYNVNSVEQLDEVYEDTMTYGEYYKQQLEKDIISTVLLYKEAEKNKIKLSDEEKQEMKVRTKKVLERFGVDILEGRGVSESDIERVYEKKLLGDSYLDSLSEDGKNENASSTLDSDKQERYVKVYQVTFPIVQLDEDGMVQSDAEGNLKKVSRAEIEEKETEAMEFSERAQQGEDIEALLEDCDETVTAIEKYLKYEDLEKEYQAEVDQLSVGEVSDVIESDYGYYVIRLLEKNDNNYAETIEKHEQQSEDLSIKEAEVDRLYSDYAQPNREYKNVSGWSNINIKNYLN